MVAAKKGLNCPLQGVLVKHIRRFGPCPIDMFHTFCLNHPAYGYYRTQDVLGKSGDFTTAPELSPLFGDVVGAFFVERWQALGCPSQITLLELGPGLGTLMSAILRVGRQFPDFLKSTRVCLVEVHPQLKAEQRKKLAPFASLLHSIEYLNSIEEVVSQKAALGGGAVFVVANEFFDVLPSKQYVKEKGSWLERFVDVSAQGAFVCCNKKGADPLFVEQALALRYPEDSIYEESAESIKTFGILCDVLQRKRGVALVIDYGYEKPALEQKGFRGDSWQGLFMREPVSPLLYPGLSDLSFHVNFSPFLRMAQRRSLKTHFQTQRDFLMQCGADKRLQKLRSSFSLRDYAKLKAGFLRLTDPLQMGSLFKVLTVESDGKTACS